MILLKQMIVLFLLMATGFICRKIGLLNEEASKKLSGLVVNVANPALILSSGINPVSPLGGLELLKIFCLAISVYIATILVAVLFSCLLPVSEKDRGLYQAMMIFSNIGFMGFPLISAIYGEHAMVMATAFLIPYNILIYTFGIHVIAGKSEGGKEKKTSAMEIIKKILNVGILACILSIVLYMTQVHVPSVIEDTVDYLGSLAAPLSMIIIGDSLTTIKIKELLSDWKLLLFSVVSLLVVPAAGILLLKTCGITGELLGVCMIMLATPVGSMNVMLAQQYGGDSKLVSKGVALTTVLSVITIPLVSMLI